MKVEGYGENMWRMELWNYHNLYDSRRLEAIHVMHLAFRTPFNHK